MAAYLTVAEFRTRSVMPGKYTDDLQSQAPGFLDALLEQTSRRVDQYLAKRYAVPFSTPPEQVKSWVTRIATYPAWLRHGFEPETDMEWARADADAAMAEVKEAADSQIGLIELSLDDKPGGVNVAYGGPRVYSEASPYVGGDVQRSTARGQDRSRRGT